MSQENTQSTSVVSPQINEHHIRIEFIFKTTNKGRLLLKKYKYPIQNNPIKYGLKITNIGNKPFPGCIITKLGITCKSDDLHCYTDSDSSVRALNCGEHVDIYMDSTVIPSKGSAFVKAEIVPLGTDIIKTYQYDEFHKKDNICPHAGQWMNAIFLQGELEILQQRTNELILALTIITVYESIVGLKPTLNFIINIFAHFFIFLGESLIALQ
jgi:hypothetical protein